MKLIQTTVIEFNDIAERERITTAFKGVTRSRLLAILDTFISGKWDECDTLLRALPRSHLEFVSCTVFDTMKARAQQNPNFSVALAPTDL